MGVWIPILCFILVIIVIPIAIIVKLKTNKDVQKIDVTANMPIIENVCRREFTQGYYLGVIKRQIPRKNGTTLIEFYPIDVEQGEEIPRPNVQSVIVKNEFIKRLPRGDLSSYREIVKLIGRSPTEYPKQMRDTTEGEWMTKEGQFAYLEQTFGKTITAGDEAIGEALKTQARGNIPKGTLAQIREINEQFRKTIPQQQIQTETPPEKKS